MAQPFHPNRVITPTTALCTLAAALHSPTTFAAILSVGRLGSGDGNIKDTENFEMACGSECSQDYPRSTDVQLTATPDAHSQFVAWSAGVCAGKSNVCALTTDDSTQTIMAYFSGAAIAAGGYHTVAVNATDGAVWVWGANDAGQLGIGEEKVQPVPTRVTDLADSKVVAIATGYQHTIALTSEGTIYGWGNNAKGQLGDNTFASRTTPVQVTELGGIITFSAGYEHTMALGHTGQVWGWGDNTKGQLGDGTTTTQSKPVAIAGIDKVIAIATGNSHTVALRNDGMVWTWGDNSKGQLGNGTTSEIPRTTPAPIVHPKLFGIVAIDAGARHTVALRNDGTVWAWGDNAKGQLGDDSKILRTTPVQVKRGLTGVRAIAAGDRHSVVLTHEGTVWTWGDNWGGQLGAPLDVKDRSLPQQLENLSHIKAITAGIGHTLVMTEDGQVLAFGSGTRGELGNGQLLDQPTPVLAQNLNLFGEVIVTPTKYTVTATAGTGGTISPTSRIVEKGKTTTFTITPKAGYSISSVTGCNGSLPENSYTTNPASYTTGPIDAPCTVKATFKLVAVPKYTVTATAGAGGTISPATRTVEKGKTTTFTVKPNSTYLVNTVTGCSGKLSGTTYTTGAITAACAVKATFKVKPVTKYAVTLKTAGTGSGTVKGAGSFAAGTTVKLTATAASGSTFTSWNPSPCAASFTMPAKGLTCTATFTKDIPQPSYVPETVKITGGCFQMGKPDDEEGYDWERPQHQVCVGDFEMGKYEVTFDEYDAFADDTGRSKPSDIGHDGNHWGRGKRPVINVDWNGAVAYTEWLSKKTGQTYRLPTEAEWEYAARAGTTTPFWTGQCVRTDQANFDGNGSYGSCPSTGMYRAKTLEVGSFPANPWGLYDTMGNVWEWTCSDWSNPYDGTEKKCSTSGTDGYRSVRGGSWFTSPTGVRSAYRFRVNSTYRTSDLGFRVVLPASRS